MKVKIKTFKYDSEDGWTFIETIIGIGIVLILASMVGFGALKYLGQAKSVAAKNDIENFALAMTAYYLDCGSFPPVDSSISGLWEKPSSDAEGWAGPYLTKKPGNDPWDNEYEYTVPGPNGLPFGIRSFGADKIEGGEGDNRDLSSWEG